MARKPDVFNVSNLDTAIGSSVKLRGNLASEGDVAIDGSLVGHVKSGGQVVVGVNARITGNISAVSVKLAGQVQGTITALDSVSLLETAHLEGDITSGTLEVALGAIFIGASKMKRAQATEVLDRDEGVEKAS